MVRSLQGLLYAVTWLIGFQLVSGAAIVSDVLVTPLLANQLVGVAAAICSLIFLYRARVNIEVMQETPPRWSRGWVIGGWFIPFGNAVVVPLVLIDLATLSTRRRPGVAWLVVAWAVTYFGGIYVTAFRGLNAPVGWPEYLVNTVAGVLFVVLLWWIADGQRAIAAQPPQPAPSDAA